MITAEPRLSIAIAFAIATGKGQVRGERITFLDTADMYGSGENERLIARAIKGRRTELSGR